MGIIKMIVSFFSREEEEGSKEESTSKKIDRGTEEPKNRNLEEVATGNGLSQQLEKSEKLSESVQLRREVTKILREEDSLTTDLLLSKLQKDDVLLENLKAINEKLEDLETEEQAEENREEVRDKIIEKYEEGFNEIKESIEEGNLQEAQERVERVKKGTSNLKTEGRIKKLLENNPEETYTAKEIEKEVNKSESSVYRALKELKDQRIVREIEGKPRKYTLLKD